MHWKKIAAVIAVIVGVIMLFFSAHTAKKAKEHKIKIEESHKKVDTLNPDFSMSKYSKPLNGKATEFKSGQKEAEKHHSMSKKFLVSGIILIIIGAGAFYYYRKE